MVTRRNAARDAEILREISKGARLRPLARKMMLSESTVLGVAYRAGLSKPCRKLTDKEIAEIRALRSNGSTLASLARDYEISFQYVSQICRGDRRISRGSR